MSRRKSTGLTTRDLGIGGNGKGSRPRNCFSDNFRNNYDSIDWGRSKPEIYSHPKTKVESTEELNRRADEQLRKLGDLLRGKVRKNEFKDIV